MRPLLIALGFIVSFAIVILVFSAITRIWVVDQGTLRTLAAILLMVFGLLMLWPRPFERLSPSFGLLLNRIPLDANRTSASPFGALALGATLGIVWTPCAGPVLGSILTLIATQSDVTRGGVLLVAYAIGATIPMLAIAYGGQSVTARVPSIARVAPRLQQALGIFVIAFAATTFLDYDAVVTAWLSQFYPNGNIGL
jgi:cytochrome c biogenesis protein CcdA